VKIVLSYPEVDRAQGAEHFTNFLLWGKTADEWDWRDRGVVIFLGGDQFFPVVIGKRLGYRTVIYAEWEARWHSLIDRFVVMNESVTAKVKPEYAHKFTVVGDLMLESQTEDKYLSSSTSSNLQIGILPGSKAAKLAMGLPLTLAIAEDLHKRYPSAKFGIPVAPTLDPETLASYADPSHNPVIPLVQGATATLERGEYLYLKTSKGVEVELRTEFPAYDWLAQCTLCFTTIGANTAELGALGVPMIVLLSTQQLDAMRAWDGVLGILANLPLVGTPIAKIINWVALRSIQGRKLAWPNIWANQQEIVPELVGRLEPQQVAAFAIDYLEQPEKLAQMRAQLRQLRGEPGAAAKLAAIVAELG
jgi:lipid-A-disaccharide synthase